VLPKRNVVVDDQTYQGSHILQKKKIPTHHCRQSTVQVRLSSPSIRHVPPAQHRIFRPVVVSHYGRGNWLAAREARRASAWDIRHYSRPVGLVYRYRLDEDVHPSKAPISWYRRLSYVRRLGKWDIMALASRVLEESQGLHLRTQAAYIVHNAIVSTGCHRGIGTPRNKLETAQVIEGMKV
jgi:hypothetical protein